MTTSLKKRFWTSTTINQTEDGWSVKLDERMLRTPAKTPLLVPSQALAEAICREWDALEDKIDPALLPYTRLSNAAIDNIERKRDDVVDVLSSYIETDLVCYRAVSPSSLIERQAQVWDPLLHWFHDTNGVCLEVTSGVLPVRQPPKAREKARILLESLDRFRLMATHDLVVLSGSFVIACSVIEQNQDFLQAWEASVLDELFQEEQWGIDAEAIQARQSKQEDFEVAARMFFAIAGDLEKKY